MDDLVDSVYYIEDIFKNNKLKANRVNFTSTVSSTLIRII